MKPYLVGQRVQGYSPASPLADEWRGPPAPALQVSPLQEMRSMREREQRVLGSYGWVDRDKGVVRIPIERAMTLVAQREAASSAPKERP